MDYEIRRPVLFIKDERLWVLADEISLAKVEYHNELIMEMKSNELYQVLADWYDKLSKWMLLTN